MLWQYRAPAADQEAHVLRNTQDRPSLPLYLTEPCRATADYGLYLATNPLLRALPSGDGHPVLVLPGLMADDASTRVIRRTLRGLGYPAHGWRLGRNIGPTPLAVKEGTWRKFRSPFALSRFFPPPDEPVAGRPTGAGSAA